MIRDALFAHHTTPRRFTVPIFDEAKAKAIIAKELDVDPKTVVPEADFIKDLRADSLDITELLMTLEDEFGIDIPDEEADKLTTVGAALDYIKAHVAA